MHAKIFLEGGSFKNYLDIPVKVLLEVHKRGWVLININLLLKV